MPSDLSASPVTALMTAPRPWLADAGLESAMVFHEGLDLPCFGAFTLLDQPAGRAALRRWFGRFAGLASGAGTGLVLDATTWRANMGWAGALGLDAAGIAAANTRAVAFARALAEGYPRARCAGGGRSAAYAATPRACGRAAVWSCLAAYLHRGCRCRRAAAFL